MGVFYDISAQTINYYLSTSVRGPYFKRMQEMKESGGEFKNVKILSLFLSAHVIRVYLH